MDKITDIKVGKYRLLVVAVDEARAVYAIADMEAKRNPTKEHVIHSAGAMNDVIQAQKRLEQHVKRYGLPKVGQRQ